MSFLINQISGRTTQIECFKINSNLHDFHYIFISAANAVRHCVTRLKHKNITGNVILDRLIEYVSRIYVKVSRIYLAHVKFISCYFGSIIGNCFLVPGR